MNHVWFISTAHGRYEISEIVFDQRDRLLTELTESSVSTEYHSLIVAEDANLLIAEQYGHETLPHPNLPLGEKWNAGFRYALASGATHVVYLGSDDLVHASLFGVQLPVDMRIVTGRRIAFLDTQSGRMLPCSINSRWGVVPWIIPASVLERAMPAPITTSENRGMDNSLISRLQQTTRPLYPVIHDPHPLCRVDVKSATNITAYQSIQGLACGAEIVEPWSVLAEFYPVDLVERLRALTEVTV